MGLTIKRWDLASRQIRINDIFRPIGIRTIDVGSSKEIVAVRDESGNIISRLWRGFSQISGVGFIVDLAVRLVGIIDWSRIFDWLVQGFYQFVNFNWNASDNDLRQNQRAYQQGLVATLGGFLGSGLGWITSASIGYGISLVIPVIGGATLAKFVAGNVLTEAADELRFNLTGILEQGLFAAVNIGNIEGYIRIRKLLKRAGAPLLDRLLGEGKGRQILQQWGAENGPVLTVAEAVEEQLEKLPFNLGLFIENAIEEFGDSFIEGGYIVAQSLDQYASTHRAQEQLETKALVIRPDKTVPQEQYIVSGSKAQIIGQAEQIINQARIIQSKDIGEVVAAPLNEVVTPQWTRRTLILHYSRFSAPPWNRLGQRGDIAKYKISDVKAGVSFTELTLLLKTGSNHVWGGIRATVKLSNGRQLGIYAASQGEAYELVQKMLTLCPGVEILPRGVTYSDVNQHRPLAQQKRPTLIYPKYATMIFRRRNLATGQAEIAASQTMQLWREPLTNEPGIFIEPQFEE